MGNFGVFGFGNFGFETDIETDVGPFYKQYFHLQTRYVMFGLGQFLLYFEKMRSTVNQI